MYRSDEIQKGIKSRFRLTFQLDPRYHVIALTMIFYQERPTEKWSVQRIREHCESCCPLTFDPNNLDDEHLSSLVNELVGLGILARGRNGLSSEEFSHSPDVWE